MGSPSRLRCKIASGGHIPIYEGGGLVFTFVCNIKKKFLPLYFDSAYFEECQTFNVFICVYVYMYNIIIYRPAYFIN